ncbi:MAG: metallophosphoesterase [Planctomycetes bacterium]|nr:metallophosphoesterase [Planctomycetota bacterium]
MAAGLRPALGGAADPALPSFGFVSFNDTHVRDARCVAFLKKAFARMNDLADQGRADFAILAGDVATAGKPEEFALFREAARSLRLPLYVVPGNHDFQGEDGSAYDAAFPGRRNYAFEHKGWRFLGLDSTDGDRWLSISARPEMIAWLRKTLAQGNPAQPTIAFTHYPLGPYVRFRLKNADAILELFRGQALRLVLSGHYHGFTQRSWGNSVLVTNRCLSVSRDNHDGASEKGFLACRVDGDRVGYQFIEVAP